MPTSTAYGTAVTRAALTYADAVLALIQKEKSGCNADWNGEWCILKKILCAQRFQIAQDFTSTDSMYLFKELIEYAGGNYPGGSTVDPYAQFTNIMVQSANPPYTPNAPVSVQIAANSASPYVYTYSGAGNIVDYYVELNAGGGVYIQAPNIQVSRNNNVFTVSSPNQDSSGNFVFLDAYRLTLIF